MVATIFIGLAAGAALFLSPTDAGCLAIRVSARICPAPRRRLLASRPRRRLRSIRTYGHRRIDGQPKINDPGTCVTWCMRLWPSHQCGSSTVRKVAGDVFSPYRLGGHSDLSICRGRAPLQFRGTDSSCNCTTSPSYRSANTTEKAKTMPRSTMTTLTATILRSLLDCTATIPCSRLKRSLTAAGVSPPCGTVTVDEQVPFTRATGFRAHKGMPPSVVDVEMEHHFLLRTSNRSRANAYRTMPVTSSKPTFFRLVLMGVHCPDRARRGRPAQKRLSDRAPENGGAGLPPK